MVEKESRDKANNLLGYFYSKDGKTIFMDVTAQTFPQYKRKEIIIYSWEGYEEKEKFIVSFSSSPKGFEEVAENILNRNLSSVGTRQAFKSMA